MIKNINVKVLVRTLGVVSLLFAVSMFFAIVRAEGGEGRFYHIMAIPAIIGAFPFLFIVEWLCPQINTIFFFFAFALDGLLYAFLIERAYTLVIQQKRWRNESEKTGN